MSKNAMEFHATDLLKIQLNSQFLRDTEIIMQFLIWNHHRIQSTAVNATARAPKIRATATYFQCVVTAESTISIR